MKRLWCVWAWAWMLVALGASAAPWKFGGWLEVAPNGAFRVDGLQFQLAHWDAGWGRRFQSGVKASPNAGTGDSKSFLLNAKWRVGGGTLELTERVEPVAPDAVAYHVALRSAEPVTTAALALSAQLSVRRFALRRIAADGKTLNFGPEYREKEWNRYYGNICKLEMELPNGVLTLEGPLALAFQDNRKFGSDEWELRIFCRPQNKALTSASLDLRCSYQPYRSTPVSLASCANMDFADRVAGDQKGGWTDQGPDNDLKNFPVGRNVFAGIPFEIVDPNLNGGRGCVVLRGAERRWLPASAEVELSAPSAGKYLYVLHAIAWEPGKPQEIGEIVCEYADDQFVAETTKRFSVVSGRNVANFWMPRALPGAEVGWRHENNSAQIGLYVSAFELSGKPVRRIRFEARGNAVWMIAGATLSNLNLRQQAADKPVVMRANEDWIAIDGCDGVKPGSALDFSPLLPKPAGKFGAVRVVGNHMEFAGQPGKPVRFYGANIAFSANFMSKEGADRMAADFAAIGYNIARIHHFDRDLSRGGSPALNPAMLDRLDYTVAAFKKQGVYITLDLFTIREPGKGAIPGYPNVKFSSTGYKALVFVSDGAMRDFEAFAANLLNHVNPYTGVAWKAEPAIASLSLINENTIFSTALRDPQVAKIFQERFAVWCAERRLKPSPADHERLWNVFLSDIYRRGFVRMRNFMNSLGVTLPLTDQNYWNNIATTLLRNEYDLVDNHFYWGHPVFLGHGWSLPAMVADTSSIRAYAGGLNLMFPTRIFGKPFSVTEWDYVNPNEYNIEGAFLMGAYGALQDWSILCRFAYSHSAGRLSKNAAPIGFFDLARDPLRRLSERAGVVAFLRGDVAVAPAVYPCVIPQDYLNKSGMNSYPALVQRLGLIGRTGTLLLEAGAAPRLPEGTRGVVALGEATAFAYPVPMVGGSDLERDSKELVKSGAITEKEWNWTANRFVSCTGELQLERDAGAFRQVTARSEAFVLPAGKRLEGVFASVENRRSFAGVLVTACDGRPLGESRRVLILHLTNTKNTDMKFRNGDMNLVDSWGQLPLLVRRGTLVLTLHAPLSGYRLWALDWSGARLSEVALMREGGRTAALLDTCQGERAVAAYELVKE